MPTASPETAIGTLRIQSRKSRNIGEPKLTRKPLNSLPNGWMRGSPASGTMSSMQMKMKSSRCLLIMSSSF